jgi:hypothetical protein
VKARPDPALAALFASAFAYYAATPGIFQGKASGDGYFGFLYLPGIVFHHTLDLAATAPEYVPVFGREATGHVANLVPIGAVAFWMPFYLAGLAVERAAGQPLTGRSPADYWFTGLGALGFGLAGAALLFRLLRRRFGLGAARFGTLAVVLATPLLWYLVTQPLYQHAIAFFTVTLLVERWDALRERAGLREAALLGAIGGLAMAVRLQQGPWAALVGIDLLRRAPGVSRLRTALAFAAGVAVAFTPQVAVWYWQFGAVRPPQPPGHMRWADPALVEVLFSTRAGLLPWSPILYLAIPGLMLAARRAPALAALAAAGFVLQILVNGAAWDYHASYTFGARRFVDGAFAFGVGLAGAWAAAVRRSPRAAAIGLALAGAGAVALNVLLMEAVRTRRLWDSAAVAAPASEYVRHLGGPRWLAAALDRTGWPFVQPAGWIWAAAHGVPASTFEAVVGNYAVERDYRARDVLLHPATLPLDPGSRYRIDGDGGVVRVLVPLRYREPVRLSLVGSFARADAVRVGWNGSPMAVQRSATALVVAVPADRVRTRARTNELAVADLPPGARLDRIDFAVGPWR